MPFFIDTSALFKRYQIEKGTDKVCDLIENSRDKIFISSLTVVEVISNLKRLYEIDHLTTERDFVQQRLFFYNDIEQFEMTILDITADDIMKAEGLILKRYMKPVDAIQVAVALNNFSVKPTFVSSDKKVGADIIDGDVVIGLHGKRLLEVRHGCGNVIHVSGEDVPQHGRGVGVPGVPAQGIVQIVHRRVNVPFLG